MPPPSRPRTTSALVATKPGCAPLKAAFVFLAARVINDKDRARLVRMADQALLVSDAVGVYCFRPVSPTEFTRYRVDPVPSHLQLDRVLFRACQELTAIKNNATTNP